MEIKSKKRSQQYVIKEIDTLRQCRMYAFMIGLVTTLIFFAICGEYFYFGIIPVSSFLTTIVITQQIKSKQWHSISNNMDN